MARHETSSNAMRKRLMRKFLISRRLYILTITSFTYVYFNTPKKIYQNNWSSTFLEASTPTYNKEMRLWYKNLKSKLLTKVAAFAGNACISSNKNAHLINKTVNTYSSHCGAKAFPECSNAVCGNRLPCAVKEARISPGRSGLNS